MKKIFFVLLVGMFMISFSSAFNWSDGNIVSYYDYEENSGTEANDSLGTWNLKADGTPSWVTGKIGFGTNVSSGNNWYNNTAGAMNLSQPFSINVWFKTINVNGADQVIISKLSSTNGHAIFRIQVKNGILSSGTNRVAGTNDIDGTTNLMNNTFYMATYIVNSTGNFLFLNGTLEGSVANANNLFYSSERPFVVGGQNFSGSISEEFVGVIDEIGIWNRSLTSSDISELYNSGDGITFPSGAIQISLDSPANNSLVSGNVTFNSTITPADGFNLTNATLFIWTDTGTLFTSKTNILLGNSTNSTSFIIDNLTTGNYEWNVFGVSSNGTDLAQNFSISNRTFSWIPFSVFNQSFESFVFETSRQEFLLGITTLPSVISVDAILNYNGTRFTSDASCFGGFCQISTAIDIPLVTSGETQNKSFFWEISIFDGTISFSTNITSDEQNVTRLHLEKCNATFTVQTLNFTAFDEQTEASVDPFMFDGSFDFWLGTGTIKRNNSISESSISSLQLCIEPSVEAFFLDGTVEYDEATGTNYTNRNYFFQNDQINNVSQDIRLGLLLAEDSTSFILKVQNRDILPVPNVLIFTERFYPGEGIFKVVQVSETDDNGRTVGFFETETVEYRFILKQNGTTVLTTNKQKIVGESVPFTLTFTIGDDEGASWEPFEDIDDLSSDISFNKTSNIVSFTYADTSGDFSLGRLVVEKVNASGLQNTIICSETSVESSAIITCNLTGNSTGQYIMRGIITRDSDPFLVEQESFAIEDFSTISGRLGLFLGWFIILISAFAFKFNEVAGIILVNLAIIMVNLIGLIAFGYVFISAMIAISIIILVVLER